MSYETFLAVMAFGLVSAGVMHSGWLWLGQRRPSFLCLVDGQGSMLQPFRVLMLMIAAPFVLAGISVTLMERGWRNIVPACCIFALAAAWCFMIGIVVLGTAQLLSA